MQKIRFPSFFKATNPKSFSFIPRYYNKHKERRKNKLDNTNKKDIKIKRRYGKRAQNHRTYKIFLFIIILSLLFYKLLMK
jgi:hypothetical protein